MIIETKKIAQRFSNAATIYDTWANPQTRIAQRLCSFLPIAIPTQILDIGCGTGLMTRLIRERYPTVDITGIDPAIGMIDLCRQRWVEDTKATFIVSSAESYRPCLSFTLIVSTCAFQWFSDKKKALRNIAHSLAPNGRLVVAIPIAGSLPELYTSYQETMNVEMPGLTLSSSSEWFALFEEAHLSIEQSSIETVEIPATDPLYVINSLRGIGAAPTGLCNESPLPDEQIKRLMEYYQTHFSKNTGVRMTYKVLYGIIRRRSE